MGLNGSLLILVAFLLQFSSSGPKNGAPSLAMAASPAEMDALLDLKSGCNNPPALRDWDRPREERGRPRPSFPPPQCSWTGITCSNETLSVTRIDLSRRCAGGSIRPSIGSFSSLELLDLSGNGLVGFMRQEIFSLRNLVRLHLQNNSLSGEIPADWSSMTSLVEVNLRKNRLNGSIPVGMFRAARLQRIKLEENNLSGEIPAEIEGLGKLRFLAVTSNQLTGQIPAQIGNVTSLRSFYAGFNRLNGTLPGSMGWLPNLAQLELQHNQLHGPIPASWSNLNLTLQTLNLSENVLTGEVPSALLIKFNGTSFLNNVGMCGATLTTTCSPPPAPPLPPRQPPWTPQMERPRSGDPYNQGSSHHHNVPKNVTAGVIGGSLGAAAVFSLLLLVFLYRRSRKRPRDGSQVQNWFSPDIQAGRRLGRLELFDAGLSRFAFQDIESHAGYFDTAHVIGKGRFATVYRSHFPDGTELAVKVFRYPIATATFDRAITILASIKHKHLLPIKAYYSTSIEKALIYDFFPMGNLCQLLHGDDGRSSSMRAKDMVDPPMTSLDWATRQRIAFGVAQALDHLHRGEPRVLHMDVKSTNVLLEMEGLLPRLTDFGIVHLISNKPADSNDEAVETEGYTAPEVVISRKYSDKSDVYSFGVVLLELITGKKAIFWVKEERLVLASWAQKLYGEGRGREIMDGTALKTSPFPEYLDRAVGLAVSCVSESPSMRPAMAEVASVLEGLASTPSPLRSPDLKMVRPLLGR